MDTNNCDVRSYATIAVCKVYSLVYGYYVVGLLRAYSSTLESMHTK